MWSMLSICIDSKAGERLKHLWLSMNRPPTLSDVVSIPSNIHNLRLTTLSLTIPLCNPPWPREHIAMLRSGNFLVRIL